MKKYSFSILVIIVAIAVASSFKSVTSAENVSTDSIAIEKVVTEHKPESFLNEYVSNIYKTAALAGAGLDSVLFKNAITGYLNFKNKDLLSPTKEIITIVDFTKSSKTKRLWIIDLAGKRILYNTLVAHGRGSGDDFAQAFSNVPESHKSSLGFYITGNTYFGKHGLSLKLDGMDNGFNDNANNRAIVIHGADYVSESFINQHGRLGRSHGCPALPQELTTPIIEVVKNKTCIFINGSADNQYKSAYLDSKTAEAGFTTNKAELLGSI